MSGVIFHFLIRLHGVHRDFSFYTIHTSNNATYRSVMNGAEEEARGFLLSASLFYPTPATSGQILWVQTPVASKWYHVVVTTNISVKETARRLGKNMGKYPGEGNERTWVKCGGRWNFFMALMCGEKEKSTKILAQTIRLLSSWIWIVTILQNVTVRSKNIPNGRYIAVRLSK